MILLLCSPSVCVEYFWFSGGAAYYEIFSSLPRFATSLCLVPWLALSADF